jgi:peptide deformylase
MAKLNIIKYGDETLRKVSREVTEITPRILTLLDDMAQTMHEANGCGLAAPQVGVLRRIVVVEVEEGELIEMINPTIIAFAGEQYEQEGCLSVPEEWPYTKRPMHVTVRAMNRKGETFEVSGSGLLARAFCHEIDHLDGKLMIDRKAPADKIPSEEEQEERRKARKRRK